MPADSRRGVLLGATAYVLWGAFPLYFRLLQRSGAVEVVAHRVLWSLVVCAALLALTRGWPVVRQALLHPRELVLPAVAAVLLALNWGVYIFAVNSGQVVEASLGYFINPLVTVLLGVVVLRERLRPMQWSAVGIGAAAVVVLTVDYGRPPWIALILASSFGVYGLIKNRVGLRVGAVPSLTIETMVLAPLAVAGLAWFAASGTSTFAANAPWQGVLLVTTGVITVVPLLCFAAAARRVPLSTIGLLQYMTPVLQLLCGVLFLGESMALSRWLGFGIVWTALIVLTLDGLRQARSNRRLRHAPVLPGLQGTVTPPRAPDRAQATPPAPSISPTA
ncbi:MAG TPA: EamA family transporter RarD [Euzebya sp.]|nr:EamA family transporter RarD [Euzebya sp.]